MSIPRLVRDMRATTAIEFAIVAPVLVAFVLGIFGAGLALWYANLVQEVAMESARCIAINSSCTAASAVCSDGTVACYVVNLANDRGFPDLNTANVSINKTDTVNTISFTTVKITYIYSIFGFATTLTGSGSFPNNT